MIDDFLLVLGRNIDLKEANYYINRAKRMVLKFTNRKEEELNEHLNDIIVDLAVYRCNLKSIEHKSSESFSGASFQYQTDIPDRIKTELKAYRKLRVM